MKCKLHTKPKTSCLYLQFSHYSFMHYRPSVILKITCTCMYSIKWVWPYMHNSIILVYHSKGRSQEQGHHRDTCVLRFQLIKWVHVQVRCGNMKGSSPENCECFVSYLFHFIQMTLPINTIILCMFIQLATKISQLTVLS